MEYKKLEHTLSPSFPKIKLISDTIINLVGLLVVVGLFWLYDYFSWPTWAFWILMFLIVFSILGCIWSFIEPTLLYRSWSYQYDHNYLQISFGIMKKQWITIPMTKIQAVSTIQGPIMQRFNTRSIKIETMGSAHTIPALEESIALQLREDLAEYAKLKEVDE
ncbi:PH domain-containing protein [Ornithinibacillus scapharcae]|uniref:PH domain-containing protein n=1 Tax=Ornithinibacillus scapharcae TaxID=1147159 RepID=UPI000225B7C0|nr:PH domain-containing protein [Ornithinibacillus scapharcae]